MFRSRRSQARVARALVARVGLERLWSDEGPTREAQLLAEAEHLPLGRRERALCRVAWLIWDGSSGITLGDLLDLTDSEDLGTIAELLRAMSVGADAVDTWLRAHAPRHGSAPPAWEVVEPLPDRDPGAPESVGSDAHPNGSSTPGPALGTPVGGR